jgi:hypothetical protein
MHDLVLNGRFGRHATIATLLPHQAACFTRSAFPDEALLSLIR